MDTDEEGTAEERPFVVCGWYTADYEKWVAPLLCDLAVSVIHALSTTENARGPCSTLLAVFRDHDCGDHKGLIVGSAHHDPAALPA
jgi:hypothetical protein